MKKKILITRKIMDSAEERLKSNFDVLLNEKDIPIKNEDFAKIADQYDGMICSGWDKLDKNFFNQLNNKLQIIAGIGIGYDNIDVESAKNKKIIVTNSPNKSNDAVAEVTIFLLIGAARKAYEGIKMVKSDKWKEKKIDWTDFMLGQSISNKTLGIIGMGRIGRVVAKRAKAFGMKVFYYDPLKQDKKFKKTNLKKLIEISDVISIHAHVNEQTKYIINKKNLKLTKKKPIIINTSRGELVKEDDIIWALKNKLISGYGADVVEKEFIDIRKSPIIKNINDYNIIVTPHIGGMTYQGQLRAYNYAVDKFKK